MKNKCPAIIALLLIIIAGGIYKFVFQGNVTANSDGRTSILLKPGERDFVLAEMRLFLTSVQQITKAISANDMKAVAESARKVGSAVQATVPGTLMGKLPMEFKTLGFDTHSKFDQLALNVEDMGDSQHALAQLTELMQNCVACHEAYRIDIANE